nr:delta IS6 family transposase [Klebsiella pneumoniae]
MPKFAANLSMLFTELPFLERFAAAARAGFEAVEFLFPYEYAAGEIRQRLQENQLQLVLFNTRHCCKVSDEAAFCLIQRPYISKTLLTRRISPRGSP